MGVEGAWREVGFIHLDVLRRFPTAPRRSGVGALCDSLRVLLVPLQPEPTPATARTEDRCGTSVVGAGPAFGVGAVEARAWV